jgi:ankyrin repeat protein
MLKRAVGNDRRASPRKKYGEEKLAPMPSWNPTDHHFVAWACHDLEGAEKLLTEHPEIPLARSGLGETPLHYLVVENKLDAVSLLIRYGAAVNTKDTVASDTPLHVAAYLGYFDMVKLLLAHGADVHAVNRDNETPLHKATVL